MELIDRYVHAVSRQLPAKIRSDVEMELRSSLEDSLEARSAAAPDSERALHARELLLGLGSPEQMAASYQPASQYLVGPQLFPLFKLVLRIVLSVYSIMALIGIALGVRAIVVADAGWLRYLAEALSSLIQGGFFAFGVIVVVFALLQRFGVGQNETEEDWDPDQLPMISDEELIRSGTGLEKIIGALILFGLLNLLPHWIGIFTTFGDERLFLPLLGENYTAYLPMINLILSGSLVFGVVLLLQSRWNVITRAMDVLLELATLILFYRLSTGPSPFDLDPQRLEALNGAPAVVSEALLPVLKMVEHWPFTLAMVGVAIAAAFSIQRLVKTVRISLRSR